MRSLPRARVRQRTHDQARLAGHVTLLGLVRLKPANSKDGGTTGSDGTPVSAVRLTRAAVNRRPTQIVVVVTTHEPKRTIRFDHAGFINPSTKQTDELMRHDAADRCVCKLRVALSAI